MVAQINPCQNDDFDDFDDLANSRISPSAFIPSFAMATTFSLVMLLSACSKAPPVIEDIRPVRVMALSSAQASTISEFPGEVQARYASQLGFRIGGKIIARKVDVGSTVSRGQILMQLDPQDLKLAQAQAVAALSAAESNRALAQADLRRYQELRSKNFVSQAVLEAKETAFKSAQSTYDQAAAGLKGQSHQTAYATLLSDVDGVVTKITAEVGQVVAAGTPVVTVTRAGAKEVVVGVPENQVEALRHSDVTVRLWAMPELQIIGTVREVSPIADAATRTYAVKIAIPDNTPNVKLGMTAYAAFSKRFTAENAANAGAFAIPLTALFQTEKQSSVWIVEKGVVHMIPVQVSGYRGNDALVTSAAGVLTAGQQLVTAGVHLLKAGQKVSILGAVDGGHDGNGGDAAVAITTEAKTVAEAKSAAAAVVGANP